MRWRLVVLPIFGLATISSALVGLAPPGRAGALDQARLRGSNAAYGAPDGPSYPIATSEPSYPSPSYPGPSYSSASYSSASYPSKAAPYPGARGPAQPAAFAPLAAELHNFSFEFGTRYWYSTGKLTKELFDDPRSSTNLNSRLTYSGLTAGSFEGFGRVNSSFGYYIRGYAGFSGLNQGALNDEDFPPGLTTYSNTLSQQQTGRLSYGSIDLGYIVAKNELVAASVFAGYGYLNETVSAFGCNQIAGNPFVCVPAIAPGVLAITEESHWQFARLGILTEFNVLECLKFSAEVAWLPFDQISAQDTHWLRLGTGLFDISGPIPESGSGSGVQVEAIAQYKVNNNLKFGLGGRYWLMQTRGGTDFENVIVGVTNPSPQPLNFSTTRYGGFAQGSYKFGPL